MTMNSGADLALGRSDGRRSLIDADSHFVGTYTTPNDLQIDGRYEGTIECAGALVVAGSADVNAQITAGAVSVVGHLQGEIGCRGRFEILPTGRVEARVVAGTIVIHDGARYQGEMRMRSAGDREAESGTSGRSDARPIRRSGSPESRVTPPLSPESSRSNGRGSREETGAPGETDRNTSPGSTISSGE